MKKIENSLILRMIKPRKTKKFKFINYSKQIHICSHFDASTNTQTYLFKQKNILYLAHLYKFVYIFQKS